MKPTRLLPRRAATPPPSRRLFLLAANAFTVSACVVAFASPLCAQGQPPQPVSSPSSAALSPPREVLLTVTVTDGEGRYVAGLGRQHFEVFEGKSPSEITSFAAEEEPASVVVLLDMSGSTASDEGRVDTWDVLRHAFVAFGRKSPRENEYALIAFNSKQVDLTDWTSDPLVLAKSLATLNPKAVASKGSGGTALYDACAVALKKFARASRRKHVLLIFTDGRPDNDSRATRLGPLKKMVRESGALVYAVAYINLTRLGIFEPDYEGRKNLEELTAASGGDLYFPETPGQTYQVAERIAAELRHQYVVGFAPAGAARPGELNKIKLKITPPALGRKIYFRGPDGYHSAPK